MCNREPGCCLPRLLQIPLGGVAGSNHHDDIIRNSEFWTKETYYAKDGGAPRGPLRGHVNVLRSELGMEIEYTDFGINVTQPED